MKAFFIRTFSFLIVTILTLLLIIVVPLRIVNYQSDFKLPGSTESIILGTSRSECAFNDSIISNTVSLAHSGESYFYTYLKLKQLILDNPNIQNIFLEFSTYQISRRMDSRIWGDKYLNWRYSNYAAFMGIDELRTIATRNIRGFLFVQSLSAKQQILRLTKSGRSPLSDFDWGGYLYLDINKADSLLLNLEKSKTAVSDDYQLSETNLHYLLKIKDLCKENGLNLFFVRTPIHPNFPELAYDEELKVSLQPELQIIDFLDFKNFPLTNQEFGDLEHLNFSGAKKFSTFFDQLLQNGLLDSEVKQKFIDAEMRQL